MLFFPLLVASSFAHPLRVCFSCPACFSPLLQHNACTHARTTAKHTLTPLPLSRTIAIDTCTHAFLYIQSFFFLLPK